MEEPEGFPFLSSLLQALVCPTARHKASENWTKGPASGCVFFLAFLFGRGFVSIVLMMCAYFQCYENKGAF